MVALKKYEKHVWDVKNPVGTVSNAFSFFSPYLRMLNRHVRGKERVLDIGCGTGKYVAYLLSKGTHAEGVDISNKAVSLARKYYPSATFKVAPAEKLPYADKTFDAVYSFDVLEHLGDPEKAVKEIKRVLKKGGIALIQYETSDRTGKRATRNNRNNSSISSWVPGRKMLELCSKHFKIKHYFFFGFFRRFSYAEDLFGILYKIPVVNFLVRAFESVFAYVFRKWRGIALFAVLEKRAD